MRKSIIGIALAALGLMAAPAASATIHQQSTGNTYPPTGTSKTAPAKAGYVRFESYLSTRDPESTRGTKKANPVGKVFMDFPKDGTVNKNAKPTCNQSEYSTPVVLAAACANSIVGTGWALLNTGSATAHDQLTGSAPACADPSADPTQYSRTWEAAPGNGPDCTPTGDLYVKVTAYQGGVLKAQWWCYGDSTSLYNTTAACNNKATGGDAKNTVLATGKGKGMVPGSGTFNDTTNKKGLNGCNIIFANDNSAAPLAFGGTDTGCKNRLTVIIPALNGDGSGLGELTGGFVLSDFYLHITANNYMKAPACPANKTWQLKTQVVFSKLKGELGDAPAAQNVTSSEKCSK
jgi:hypothetical protein